MGKLIAPAQPIEKEYKLSKNISSFNEEVCSYSLQVARNYSKWRHSTTKLTVTNSLVETGLYSTTTTEFVTIKLWIYCKQLDQVEITRPLLHVGGAKWQHSISPILTTLRWKYGLCSTTTRLQWSSSTASNQASANHQPPTPTPCKLRKIVKTKWRYSALNLRK